MNLRRYLTTSALLALIVLGAPLVSIGSAGGISGAIYTTTKDGTAVNQNIYGTAQDVYLSGGPQNTKAAGLPDGTYYFQVTDPSGKTLLSSDDAVCRQLSVVNGRVAGSTGPSCKHANGTLNPANGALPVQLAPFDKTPNVGEEYKAWLIPVDRAVISPTDPKVLIFGRSDAKTDNFKAHNEEVVQGSCQPSSSLSVSVSGSNVVSYVPKGAWATAATGVAAVNVEGSSITDTLIPTTSVVNSCASNPTSGQTVCTANNTDVYVLKGTALDAGVSPNPLTSGGSGLLSFSGGSCTNCGVAMDATHNKALVGLSLAGAGGFQFLNLATSTFEPAFASMAPGGPFPPNISEDSLIDPIRNLLLSASETNNYEIVDVTNSLAPAFFENNVGPPADQRNGEMDSSGEDCSTGIVLAGFEFADNPSEVYLADISNPAFATFTPGSPGTWSAPQQIQSLAGSVLTFGANGVAVAQGTHTGILSGEFGGDAITAIALPATSGGGAVPAISDWVTCRIPSWVNGLDPHTLTAYQSPTGGDAIGLLANFGASSLARVDLTQMLNMTTVPRTGNVCTAGTLPPSVVSFIPVP